MRLTPAGRQLVQHAQTILAAVTAAEADLSNESAPHGELRVGSYATALRRWLLPAAAAVHRAHPRVRINLQEREPAEISRLLDDDLLDLGLVYDYSLLPAAAEKGRRILGATPMMLAVPDDDVPRQTIANAADLAALRDRVWICNSRGPDDDELAHRLCALAGWAPTVRHRADSLELVAAMVAAGHGVAIVPADAPCAGGVRLLPITIANVRRRTWSVTRPGRERWPATAALLLALHEHMTGEREQLASPP